MTTPAPNKNNKNNDHLTPLGQQVVTQTPAAPQRPSRAANAVAESLGTLDDSRRAILAPEIREGYQAQLDAMAAAIGAMAAALGAAIADKEAIKKESDADKEAAFADKKMSDKTIADLTEQLAKLNAANDNQKDASGYNTRSTKAKQSEK